MLEWAKQYKVTLAPIGTSWERGVANNTGAPCSSEKEREGGRERGREREK